MKYRIYIGALQDVPNGIEFSYWNGKSAYMLVASEKKPGEGFKRLKESLYYELCADEQEWIFETQAVINARYIESHQADYLLFADDFIESFEKELRKEAERMRKETGNGGE